jgi:hypothetical protein
MARMEPMVAEESRGTPISVYGRTLTPVCRVVSRLRRRGTIETARVEARGGGMLTARPVAVMEEQNGELRVLPIHDVTGSMLRQMAWVGIAVSVAAVALVFARRWVRN